MPKLKLTYFDFHGGRGEPARLALAVGGVAFDDDRVPPPEWAKRKAAAPFGGAPVLEVDGKPLSQSNAINRYVGKLAGLYPSDAWQAALCDEAMDAVEDIETQIGATFNLTDEQKRVERKRLVEGPLPFFLTRLQQRLEDAGGSYFADGRLTVADLKVFVYVRRLKSGKLDHIPTDLTDRAAPKLVAHHDRIKSQPQIQAWYAKHGATA